MTDTEGAKESFSKTLLEWFLQTFASCSLALLWRKITLPCVAAFFNSNSYVHLTQLAIYGSFLTIISLSNIFHYIRLQVPLNANHRFP